MSIMQYNQLSGNGLDSVTRFYIQDERRGRKGIIGGNCTYSALCGGLTRKRLDGNLNPNRNPDSEPLTLTLPPDPDPEPSHQHYFYHFYYCQPKRPNQQPFLELNIIKHINYELQQHA